MPSFNRVALMGHVTRDIEFKQLPNTSVAEFGMAMNRKFKTTTGEQREEVCFVDCAAFGKTAEVIRDYVHRGDPFFIEGRLKYDTWEDKNGGGKRHKLSVVVDNFQFLGGGGNKGKGGKNEPASAGRGLQAPAGQMDNALLAAGVDPADIPF